MRVLVRIAAPIIAGAIALVAAEYVGATLAWILMLVAVALLFDGVTKTWARNGERGNLTTHRQ
jgi:hypothetical protein